MPKVSNAEERKVANVLWRKVSVRNRTRQGNIAMDMVASLSNVVVTGRLWHADIPAIYGRQSIIWEQILYGRYLAHGSLQILTAAPGQTVTLATSGWQQEGFDWKPFRE